MDAKSGTSAPVSGALPWLKAYPQGIDWAMPLEPRPLNHLLDTAARDYPQNPAISFKGKDFSVAFNPGFLQDPLRALTEEEIFLEVSDEMSPGVIKIGTPFLYVLMPMRIS